MRRRAGGRSRVWARSGCILLVPAAAMLAAPAGACAPDARGPLDGEGLRHGECRIVHCDGSETARGFRHGDRHGPWIVRYPDGRTAEGSYAKGRKDGAWTYGYSDGSRVHGVYREGWMSGLWTLSDAGGAAVERECWRDGRWAGAAGTCAE